MKPAKKIAKIGFQFPVPLPLVIGISSWFGCTYAI
jgi:hypothetical protein